MLGLGNCSLLLVALFASDDAGFNKAKTVRRIPAVKPHNFAALGVTKTSADARGNRVEVEDILSAASKIATREERA